MLLGDVAHGEVGETFLLVVVECGLLHAIVKTRVETAELTAEVSETEGIAQFGTADVFEAQVVYKIVLHASGHKGIACQRCGCVISGSECEAVIGGRTIVEDGFSATTQEASLSALAV